MWWSRQACNSGHCKVVDACDGHGKFVTVGIKGCGRRRLAGIYNICVLHTHWLLAAARKKLQQEKKYLIYVVVELKYYIIN